MIYQSLFSNSSATDRTYINLRSKQTERQKELHDYCEGLWNKYKDFSDTNFVTEIARDFQPRFWEMYLTVSLIDMGFKVECPKPGPDVGIVLDNKTIWFEATCPTRGAAGNPNQVPAIRYDGTVQCEPNEKMVLRYLNSINEKYQRQYQSWISQKFISQDDPYIIAINPMLLDFDIADSTPPRILQAVFPLGDLYVEFDQENLEPINQGFQHRSGLSKANSSNVKTGIFLDDEFNQLSAVLCSRTSVIHHPDKAGDDFQLVSNPLAKNSLPRDFKLRGTHFYTQLDQDEYEIKREIHKLSSEEKTFNLNDKRDC
ncbi:MAG: hypothetical protein ABJN57_04250 [Hyphomicrobiales bacterium]